MTIDEIAIKLVALIKKAMPRQVKTGTVKSVDTSARTCVVDPGNDTAPVNDVRLQAVGNTANGLLIVPKVGSKVLYGIIDNEEAANYIVKTTTVDKIELNGSQYKGLVKHDELKTALDKINTNVATLKAATNSIAVALDALVPGTSTAFGSATTGVTDALTSNLKNDTVTHG